MARTALREPTIRELDERLTTVERQLVQVVAALISANQAATREFQWHREAFIQHRDEVREAFDKTAGRDEMREGFNRLHELIAKLTE
jgi:hypothetical protein